MRAFTAWAWSDNGSVMNTIDLVYDPLDNGRVPEWNGRFRGGCDRRQYICARMVGKNASSIVSPIGEDPRLRCICPRKITVPKRGALCGTRYCCQGPTHMDRHPSAKQTAMFDDAIYYKMFLVSIPTNQACDILHYSGYVQQTFSEDNNAGKDHNDNSRILPDLLDDWANANFCF